MNNELKMTATQISTLAKLQNGQTIVLNYKNTNGIKLVTLECLKKLGKIDFERVSAPHLSGSTKAFLITIK